MTSKSDPFCVIFARDRKTNELVEIGKTEVIKDNLNPKWETKITMEYRFEERQELNITVYDFDGDVNKKHKAESEYLGNAVCTIGEIVAAPFSKVINNCFSSKMLLKKSKSKLRCKVTFVECIV